MHHPNISINTQPTPSPSPHLPLAPEPVKPPEAKSVMFDLQPQEFEFTPESEKVPETTRERESGREGSRKRDRERGRRRRDDSPDSDASDATIELPPRFDPQGRSKEEDPLAQKLESVLTSLFR